MTRRGRPPLSQEENERRFAVYQEHLDDRQSGRRLRISCKAYASWRKKNGLKSNYTRKLPEEEHNKRLDLHSQGLTDSEIAEVCHLTVQAVRAWRYHHGLPANRRHKWDVGCKFRRENGGTK